MNAVTAEEETNRIITWHYAGGWLLDVFGINGMATYAQLRNDSKHVPQPPPPGCVIMLESSEDQTANEAANKFNQNLLELFGRAI